MNINNIVTFKICPQQFNPNRKILLLIGTVAYYIPARRLCSKSPEPEPNDSSKIFKKISQMQNLGQLGPKNYVRFLHVFSLFSPSSFSFFLFSFLFLFSLFFSFFLLIACLVDEVWKTSLIAMIFSLVHQVLRETID